MQTIQATGKLWKGMQLLSGLAVVAGVLVCLVAGAWGGVLIVGGIFFFCIGRIGAWWFHEVLAQCDFNVSEAARRLGMHRRTLARKIEKKRIQ